MHHPTDRIAHTTAFVIPVVEHWLEREISSSDECWCQKGTSDMPSGSIPSGPQPIPDGPRSNGPVGNPVLSQDHAAGKGST